MLPVATLLRPPAAPAASRRRFLVGAAVAGAGLTIGFGAPGAARAADGQGAPDTVVDAVRGLPAHRARQHGHGARRRTWRWARAPTPASPPWSPRSSTPTGRRCAPRAPGATRSSTATSPGAATCRAPAARPRWRARSCATARPAPWRGPCWSRPRPRRGTCRRPRSGSRRACSRTRPASARPWASWRTRRRGSARRRWPRCSRPTTSRSRTPATSP